MPLDFPAAPSLNQQFLAANGVAYIWNGSYWMVATGVGPSYLPLTGGTLSGDLIVGSDNVNGLHAYADFGWIGIFSDTTQNEAALELTISDAPANKKVWVIETRASATGGGIPANALSFQARGDDYSPIGPNWIFNRDGSTSFPDKVELIAPAISDTAGLWWNNSQYIANYRFWRMYQTQGDLWLSSRNDDLIGTPTNFIFNRFGGMNMFGPLLVGSPYGGSNAQPAIRANVTWNDGAVDFAAYALDLTNTASGAGSKLIRLNVGGATVFSVDTSGSMIAKTGRFSAIDGALILGGSGATKGIRIFADAVGAMIEGVDHTLGLSYQPLSFAGTIINFNSPISAGTARFSGAIEANNMSPTMVFQGDIDGAKWLTTLGGYRFSWLNDAVGLPVADTGSVAYNGRTYYPRMFVDANANLKVGDWILAKRAAFDSPALGQVLNDTMVPLRLQTNDGNIENLTFYLKRVVAGNDWSKTRVEIERTVDGNEGGHIYWQGGEIGFGWNTYPRGIGLGSNGYVNFANGASYVGPDGSFNGPSVVVTNGITVGGVSTGRISMADGGANTGYMAFWTPANVRRGYIGFGGAAGGLSYVLDTAPGNHVFAGGPIDALAGLLVTGPLTLQPNIQPNEGGEIQFVSASSGTHNATFDAFQNTLRMFSTNKTTAGNVGLWDMEMATAATTFYGEVNTINTYKLNGQPVLIREAGDYTALRAPLSAVNNLTMGNTVNPTSYYTNAVHMFRALDQADIFGQFTTDGLISKAVILRGNTNGALTQIFLENLSTGDNAGSRILFNLNNVANAYGLVELNNNGPTEPPMMNYFIGAGGVGHAFNQSMWVNGGWDTRPAMTVYGGGATSPNPSTTTGLSATLRIHTDNVAPGTGGMILFGMQGGTGYAAIKGQGVNGANNTQGQLVFATRRVDTDATLTQAMAINYDGNTLFNGVACPAADGAYTLGAAGNRWSVVYAVSATINTSGRDTKTELSGPTDAERRAAARIKSIGTTRYKFRDAVEKKGDKARYHFGYVAEDIRDALAAEGLDPWAYGMLCSDEIEGGQHRLGLRYDELYAFLSST